MADKKPNKKAASKKAAPKKAAPKKRAPKKAAPKRAASKTVARRSRKALPDISSASWEHATDRAALHALRNIPGFDIVIRKVIGAIGERNVKLIFTENQIEVTANSPDVGEAQETLEVGYTGPEMQIAFNPEFLQAPLRALDTDNVYLDLIDEMSPGVLRIDGSFLYVLMPMRVTN